MTRPRPPARTHDPHEGRGVRRRRRARGARTGSPPRSRWRSGWRWPGTPAHRVVGHDAHAGSRLRARGRVGHARRAPAWRRAWTEHLASVAYCTDADLAPEQEFNVVTLTLREPPTEIPGTATTRPRPVPRPAACAARTASTRRSTCRPAPLRWSGEVPRPDVVRRLPDALREQQTIFSRTGGVHAAALCEPDGTLLVVREDVGPAQRRRQGRRRPGAGGRATQRAPAWWSAGGPASSWCRRPWRAGVGSLVAVGAPTSLSAQLARDSGLALFGFTARRTVRALRRDRRGYPTVVGGRV